MPPTRLYYALSTMRYPLCNIHKTPIFANSLDQTKSLLRHAVLWRKSSGGTDSEAGSRFVERMLSVVATARQQNRNVLELLTACCRARLDGSAAPSLLPAQAELVAPPDWRILAGGGLLGSPILVTGEGFLARFPRNLGFLGGARKPLPRRPSQLYSGACRLGRLPGVGRALNGYLEVSSPCYLFPLCFAYWTFSEESNYEDLDF